LKLSYLLLDRCLDSLSESVSATDKFSKMQYLLVQYLDPFQKIRQICHKICMFTLAASLLFPLIILYLYSSRKFFYLSSACTYIWWNQLFFNSWTIFFHNFFILNSYTCKFRWIFLPLID